MKVIRIVSLMGVVFSLGTEAFAETPFSVRVEGGLTGYGGAVLYEVNPYVSLALGYNTGTVNWRKDIKINNINYDLEMNNNTTYFNAIVRPWGMSKHGWLRSLYTAVGIGYIGDNYDVHRYFKPGEKRPSQLNKFVPRSSGVEAEGYLDYSSTISPYLGIGAAPQFSKNWAGFFEIGAYYTGDAEIHLTHVNGRDVGSLGAKTDFRVNDEVIYKWHPVAKIGVTYTF